MDSVAHDLYLKYQSPKSVSIICHRVWDGQKFFRSQQAEGLKDPKLITLVTLSSEQEYRDSNWKK
jgi:hypothetical protein